MYFLLSFFSDSPGLGAARRAAPLPRLGPLLRRRARSLENRRDALRPPGRRRPMSAARRGAGPPNRMAGRPAGRPMGSDSGSTPAPILEERAAQSPEVGPDPAALSKSGPAAAASRRESAWAGRRPDRAGCRQVTRASAVPQDPRPQPELLPCGKAALVGCDVIT